MVHLLVANLMRNAGFPTAPPCVLLNHVPHASQEPGGAAPRLHFGSHHGSKQCWEQCERNAANAALCMTLSGGTQITTPTCTRKARAAHDLLCHYRMLILGFFWSSGGKGHARAAPIG